MVFTELPLFLLATLPALVAGLSGFAFGWSQLQSNSTSNTAADGTLIIGFGLMVQEGYSVWKLRRALTGKNSALVLGAARRAVGFSI